ncbi:MAG TPA: hypothetical protein DCL77_14210 [Prolixibacteraceae bacterium]|jgi:uncharacterized protein (TIGR02145 family)|nr:hypothetical protein [Prolixibacteraceae bacterium]
MKVNFSIWIVPMVLIGALLLLVSSCKKDEVNNSLVRDIDGNVYHTVTIGSQVWMVENLKTTRYRNGDSIPNINDSMEWSQLSTGAQCIYYNNSDFGFLYGKLYNWYAVNDPRNIAPKGWHIPTDADWMKLENYAANHLGYSSSVGKALAATSDWTKFMVENGVGNDLTKNNSLGFTALPGGNRYVYGKDDDIGEVACWWSSTEGDESTAWSRGLYCYYANMSRNCTHKASGLSVRCIKD